MPSNNNESVYQLFGETWNLIHEFESYPAIEAMLAYRYQDVFAARNRRIRDLIDAAWIPAWNAHIDHPSAENTLRVNFVWALMTLMRRGR